MVNHTNIRKRWLSALLAFVIVVIAGGIVRYQDSKKNGRKLPADTVIRIPAGSTTSAPSIEGEQPVSTPQVPTTPVLVAPQTKRTHADASQLTEEQIVKAIQESRARVAGLSVRIAGDIVILKGNGRADDAQAASTAVTNLGIRRVANLITPPATIDDSEIRRNAERQLASAGALQGTQVQVTCNNGVVRLSGTVRSELQKDAAAAIVRRVPGATNVQLDLKTM